MQPSGVRTMRDLTTGSITRHLLTLSVPIAVGMVFQTLYYLVDIYFVGRLGGAAVAGLATAGNIVLLVVATTQLLSVGTMALIAQASGRKDHDEATLVFNQSLGQAALGGLATIGLGYGMGRHYMASLGADQATMEAGMTYLVWFLPGLGLQFALVSMGAALRGMGIVTPTVIVQTATVALNVVLSPIMIAGWVTGRPLGLAGAGLSTSISVAVAVVLMSVYFARRERFVVFDRRYLRPRIDTWKRSLAIGLPSGGEFVLMFLFMAVTFWAIRGFGADAQAGYGLGSRIMQAMFLPALAVALAGGPLAGQNVGARQPARVCAVFRTSAFMLSGIMLTLTVLCQWKPALLLAPFEVTPAAVAVAIDYLRVISWNFVAVGIVLTTSSLFQGLGNTVPALLASSIRLATFVIPAVWLTTYPAFQLYHLWWLAVITNLLHAVAGVWLLRREFGRRLAATEPATGQS